jgi:hypothetical protein
MAVRILFTGVGNGTSKGLTLRGDATAERDRVLFALREERWVAIARREPDGWWYIMPGELGAGSAWRTYKPETLTPAQLAAEPPWAPKTSTGTTAAASNQQPAASTVRPRPAAPGRYAALRERLMVGGFLAFIMACILNSGSAALAIAALLTPAGIVAVGVLLLAAAAWPRWWPLVGQLRRQRPA